MKKITRYLVHPTLLIVKLSQLGVLPLSDSVFLRLQFKQVMGYKLNLDNPKTFNEKLQWLKIWDRDPKYIELVDKSLVKNFIKEAIGRKYVIDTYGVYDDFDDIDFDSLPEKFVVKTTHYGGGNGIFIVTDKGDMNTDFIRKQIKKILKKKLFRYSREWPYKGVSPRIIIERYIEDPAGDLRDYKFFVFSGKAKYIQVDFDRFTQHKRNFYSINWERQPFTIGEYPTNSQAVQRPKNLTKMIDLAEKISASAGSPAFLRVDMYSVGNKILFGETTFYQGAGLEKVTPTSWDKKLGDLIALPEKRK